MRADAPIRPPSRLLAVAVVLLCVAGPTTLVVDRWTSEAARISAPTTRDGVFTTTHRLVKPERAARALGVGAVQVLGPATPLTARIPGAILGLTLPETRSSRPWLLLCDDTPSCLQASAIADGLVARGEPVMGLAPLPESIVDALDEPAQSPEAARLIRRARERVLATLGAVAGPLGWLLTFALLPLALLVLVFPATHRLPVSRDRLDVLIQTLARLGRLGVLALVANTAMSAPEIAAAGPSLLVAILASACIAGAGWTTARTPLGRWGALGVAVAALPWLAGWPLPLHGLIVGAAVAEAAVASRGRR